MSLKSIAKDAFQLLKDFFRFMRSPDPNLPSAAWDGRTVLLATLTGFMVLGIGTVLSIGMSFIGDGHLLESADEADRALIKALPNWFFLIAACTVAPVGEELFLRLPLKPGWKQMVISFCAGVCMLLFFNQLAISKIYFQQSLSFETERFLPALLVAIVSSVYFLLPAKYQQNKIVFTLFLYAMVFIFGILHRFNRIHGPLDILLAFRDTALQVFSGLYFSFLRMRFGIRLSIVGHSIWNLFPALLRFL